MTNLLNVREEIRNIVARSSIATEVANALNGLFTVEAFRIYNAYNWRYTALNIKPTRSIADSLLLDREVLALIVNVSDLQVRTLHVANDLIKESDGRLEPNFVIVVHADKMGDDKLRTWGREQGIKVIPILRSKAGAIASSDSLRRILAQDLFSHDPFSLTGPVLADSEFFGRRNSAIEILRQLQNARIVSLFGIRKIGKTSLINRIVNLAREGGNPKVAMIDCSVDSFSKLSAQDALRAIAKATKMAYTRGYAHISEALKRPDDELSPVFDDLWSKDSPHPLSIVFDEIDYITPASPTQQHWKQDFNIFWREFRVIFQEANRMGFPLSVLVSGVSSQAFRVESFEGIENSVLHFVPESYLTPFARTASKEMIKKLCKRCGLILHPEDQDKIAEICGDFPYWIRLAGSYIHRSIDVQGRPVELESSLVTRILGEFIEAEGSDVARVALEDLRRKTSEPIELLKVAAANPFIALSDGKLLVRYGLASQVPAGVKVTSSMIKAGLSAMTTPTVQPNTVQASSQDDHLHMVPEEWAEELAMINRRRNLLERKLREFIQFSLKYSAQKGESWVDKVLKSLSEHQRTELSALSGDALLSKLYWKDLDAIIRKHWASFEKVFGDKARFQNAMSLLNDRPDTHAKPIDMADVALYRRELGWIEDRLA
jgi:hypothetical protein